MSSDTVIGKAKRVLISGQGEGDLLFAHEGLSLWGGVDTVTSEVIDRHHPLSGQTLVGKVLAIPCGRGSCTGSGVLMELLLKGLGPSAIILNQPEDILTLGVLIAEEMFGTSIPVIELSPTDFSKLATASWLSVANNQFSSESLAYATSVGESKKTRVDPLVTIVKAAKPSLILSDFDRSCLMGEYGKAHKVAMRIITRMARLQGADSLLDICQGHIDGCIYTGEAGLLFAKTLVEWGASVSVPTTLNSISVDRQRWKQQGVPEDFASAASELAQAYVSMGCTPTYTCAPYLLETAPKEGEQIAWAESNAVVFANSVLGARSLKYPDYLDICIAITGRAPRIGCHQDEGRKARFIVNVSKPEGADDAFYPLLGYWVGKQSNGRIPAIIGLQNTAMSKDDLKAFGAAFATTSSAPMFHIVGVTPEAKVLENVLSCEVTLASDLPALELSVQSSLPQEIESMFVDGSMLSTVWLSLNTTESERIDMVCLGNPHLSVTEIERIAHFISGQKKSSDTRLVVTCSRAIYDFADAKGYCSVLTDFGVEWITDTCWCMIDMPILPSKKQTLMTNSGKYAHYGPGISGCGIRFGSLEACLEAAITGHQAFTLPLWLINK